MEMFVNFVFAKQITFVKLIIYLNVKKLIQLNIIKHLIIN